MTTPFNIVHHYRKSEKEREEAGEEIKKDQEGLIHELPVKSFIDLVYGIILDFLTSLLIDIKNGKREAFGNCLVFVPGEVKLNIIYCKLLNSHF